LGIHKNGVLKKSDEAIPNREQKNQNWQLDLKLNSLSL
jgi:hypothetical protein